MAQYNAGPIAAGVEPAEAARSYCLLADDDPGICRAIAFTLKKLGIDSADVGRVAELEPALNARTPQLIFLDLGLAQPGGMTAHGALPLLARQGYSGLVQLMSGRSQHNLDEAVLLGQSFGLRMLPALTKPFRLGVLKDLAARLVSGELGSLGQP